LLPEGLIKNERVQLFITRLLVLFSLPTFNT
jgi:hypothetical protein